jgi:universal stress protein A
LDTPFHKILVPIDFSADAEHATQVASELSRIYSAPLMLVHIYDPVAYPLPDGYMMYTPGQLSRMWAEFEERLARARSDARDAGAIQPDARLLQGLTAAEIVRFAKEGGYDLIVMGTHGRSARRSRARRCHAGSLRQRSHVRAPLDPSRGHTRAEARLSRP